MKWFMYVFIGISLITLSGCVTTREFNPPELPKIEFEKTEPYTLNNSLLDDAISDNIISLQSDIKYGNTAQNNQYIILSNDENKADSVILSQDGYSKLANILELVSTYKDVAKSQEVLINSHINTINSLKELQSIEQQKLEIYRDQWKVSENLYRDSEALRQRQNIINTIKIYGCNAFWIIMLATL